MKKLALALLLLTLIPLKAAAFNMYDNTEMLSYVAMPLAVSAVSDVRGVQTDRVAELVTYMNEANVQPADFVDVFRYVPVALVLRNDSQPDFVQWVQSKVAQGVNGQELVNVMERRLRSYSNYVPVSTRHGYRHRR